MNKQSGTLFIFIAGLLICNVTSIFAESDSRLELTRHSLYNISSEWQNQTGETLPFSQLHGKVQVVAMVYTSCQYACPRILAELKNIETALAEYSTGEIGFCIVTIDPERDTIEAYKDYAVKQSLDSDRWTFLRGSAGDILELANLLGVKYKKLYDGEFSHSNIITLLNEEGEVVYQLNGLGADPAPIIEEAEELLE